MKIKIIRKTGCNPWLRVLGKIGYADALVESSVKLSTYSYIKKESFTITISDSYTLKIPSATTGRCVADHPPTHPGYLVQGLGQNGCADALVEPPIDRVVSEKSGLLLKRLFRKKKEGTKTKVKNKNGYGKTSKTEKARGWSFSKINK